MTDQIVQDVAAAFQKAQADIETYFSNWAQQEHAKVDEKLASMKAHAAKKLESALTDVASSVTSGGIIGEIEKALGIGQQPAPAVSPAAPAVTVGSTASAAPAAPVAPANPPQATPAS